MAIDLKSMTRKELEKLSQNIEKQLERLNKQDLISARIAAEKAAAALGFTLNDLIGSSPAATPRKAKKAKAKSAAKPKYANPDNASQTWTGKGRQPKWFKEATAAGQSLDSLAI